ncbi:hypothetical protein [Chryseobacterium indoltheticum]|uniref:hypothetical protein n=1 Tax=Chryseobacterium indoltheticum TaxID=254 RepID=UPI000F4F2763|nr:hypothetical protein [Chryseobacterium indoltheticum]
MVKRLALNPPFKINHKDWGCETSMILSKSSTRYSDISSVMGTMLNGANKRQLVPFTFIAFLI